MSEDNKTEGQAEAQAAELTVQDLASIKQIIDVASQRGAFKPNEMMTVGQVYNKLEAFLSAVQKQQQKDAPAEGTE
jgi:hypothetical protein